MKKIHGYKESYKDILDHRSVGYTHFRPDHMVLAVSI